MSRRCEPLFLNPVIVAKTYIVYDSYGDEPIGEVNASNVTEAFQTARAHYGKLARTVCLKEFKGLER